MDDKKKTMPILTLALACNVLPQIWNVFLYFYFIFQTNINPAFSFRKLFFCTFLLYIVTFFVKLIKNDIHASIGLKRSVQICGLLYFMIFFLFYKSRSFFFIYLASILLGFMNALLLSTFKIFCKKNLKITKVEYGTYSGIGYYTGNVFWTLFLGGIIYGVFGNLPEPNSDYIDNYRIVFRYLTMAMATISGIMIEISALYIDDIGEYNQNLQNFIKDKFTEERNNQAEDDRDNDQYNYIGQDVEESISNIYSNVREERSYKTLFTDKKQIEIELFNVNGESFKEDEINKTVQFNRFESSDKDDTYTFLHNIDGPERSETYDAKIEDLLSDSDNNLYIVFMFNILRIATLNYLSNTLVFLGMSYVDDLPVVLGSCLIYAFFMAIGQYKGFYATKFSSYYIINGCLLFCNCVIIVLGLSLHSHWFLFCVFAALIGFLKGYTYYIGEKIGNEFLGFIDIKIAKKCYKVENMLSYIPVVLLNYFVVSLNFNLVLIVLLIINICMMAGFFFLKRRYQNISFV